MTTLVKTQVIDADAHVVETDRTWDYLEPSEQKYRPLLYTSNHNDVSDYWVIDGEIGGTRFPTLSEQKIEQLSQNAGRNMVTPKESRELDDVQMRLDHMDQLGVDVQVLHNTIWLETVTTWPDTQAALCRSWNKWLADIWKQGKGRLRWSCVVPDLMVDEAINQIRFSKENGAVAVCMKPLEGDRLLTDPYFHPSSPRPSAKTWPSPSTSPTATAATSDSGPPPPPSAKASPTPAFPYSAAPPSSSVGSSS